MKTIKELEQENAEELRDFDVLICLGIKAKNIEDAVGLGERVMGTIASFPDRVFKRFVGASVFVQTEDIPGGFRYRKEPSLEDRAKMTKEYIDKRYVQ